MVSKRRNTFYENKKQEKLDHTENGKPKRTLSAPRAIIFLKGKKAAETCRKICDVYEKDAAAERVCHKWFSRFRSGNFSVQDAPRSCRPTEINSDEVKEMVDTNPRYTTRQIAYILEISKSSVENHPHQLGYVSRLDVWRELQFKAMCKIIIEA
ncbi:hypothetical protein AAG570_003228 [Ranatra chinensis]|uniref:Mos1 transposase HTH domain-containing protein n=1 Tax=Ranatra chinensis TaxID=642074 RepID=A0ABD0YSY1_9HEMI